MGSFFRPILPSFVLSINVPMTNTRANWLRFGAFLSPPARFLMLSLHAPPRRDQRDQVRAQTLPHWLPPDTDRRPPNCQKPNDPDLDERLFYFSMSRNQAIFKDKIICSSPLAAAQPLIILSWPEALDASSSRHACHTTQCPFSLSPCLEVGHQERIVQFRLGNWAKPLSKRSPARALPRERKQLGTRRSRDSAKKSNVG